MASDSRARRGDALPKTHAKSIFCVTDKDVSYMSILLRSAALTRVHGLVHLPRPRSHAHDSPLLTPQLEGLQATEKRNPRSRNAPPMKLYNRSEVR